MLVESTGRQEPYIVALETDEIMQCHIYIEFDCLLSAYTLSDALADLISTYFVFDILHAFSFMH